MKMKWTEICIHTTQEAVEPISNILHEAGAGGVVIEDREDLYRDRESAFGEIYYLSEEDYPEEGVLLKAYLPENSFLGETVKEIKESITQLRRYSIDIGKNLVSVSEVDEEDWATAWKKYYKPVKVGSRITISPSWEKYEPVTDQELVVELDPGMAFGTGTHPTTVLCIQAMEKHLNSGDRMIDVGTGSGVLAVAAARLGAESIEALDLDEVAVQSAADNVKWNKVEDRVKVMKANLLDHIEDTYDVITANILAEVIVNMTEDAYTALRPGGKLIVSGIIQRKREMVKEALNQAGFHIEEITEMEDWISVTAIRPEEV